MKLNNANTIRNQIIRNLFDKFSDVEDCGFIASNSFNFPIVADDGEEGWVEIVVKVPKGTKDEEYDGYALREDFTKKTQEAAEKKAERARIAAEKKAKKEKKKVE